MRKIQLNRLQIFIASMTIAIVWFTTYAWTQQYYRADSGQTVTVNEYNNCKKVTNSSPNSYFIPTNIQAEWDAFVGNLPSGVSLDTCELNIANSLRFNGTNTYLSRTPTATGNRKTWTFSTWIKRWKLGTAQVLLQARALPYATPDNGVWLFFNADDTLSASFIVNGGAITTVKTTRVFRDPSAFYHLMLSVDTTQATASGRVRLYSNGREITNLNSPVYPAQNADTAVNYTLQHKIGMETSSSNAIMSYLDGYLADTYLIDGQSLLPIAFGQLDSNGAWIPKSYVSTYGTNGFHLDYSNENIGLDTSWQNNHWTPNNFMTTGDVLLLHGDGTNGSTVFTDSAGNKTVTPYGNTQISTTQVKFGSGAMYFDGSGDYVSIPTSSDFDFGTGDFTVDFWARSIATENGTEAFSFYESDTNYFRLSFNNTHNGSVYSWLILGMNGSFITSWTSGAYTDGVWRHYSVTRSGNNVRLFINGQLVGTMTVTTPLNLSSAGTRMLGACADGGPILYWNWNLDEVRITKGIARWTANFTPPSAPYTPSTTNPDRMLDSPTNNFATLNPLPASITSPLNGNLTVSTNLAQGQHTLGTLAMSSWKYYWETKIDSVVNGTYPNSAQCVGVGVYPILTSKLWCYYWYTGNFINDNVENAYWLTFTAGSIIGVALDMDSGKMWFSKDGAWQSSSDNSFTNANPAISSLLWQTVFPLASDWSSTAGVQFTLNFGQWGQSWFTYYPSAGGSFKYQPPTGFKALSTANLPPPAISNPKQYFDVLTYTGNESIQSIGGLLFQPDLVWIKDRNATYNHGWFDSVRGIWARLSSNSTWAEIYPASWVNGFNQNWFSLGTSINENKSPNPHVAWNWKAGWTAVTNNSGTIQSQVSANSTAGFSILSYSGNSVLGATVWHGLWQAPAMMIIKGRNSTQSWLTYHWKMNATPQNGKLWLNNTNTYANDSWVWNNTAPTSTGITLGNGTEVNTLWTSYVGYVWSEVPWFSKFGSYTGNGSADGVFVYTGFKPRWIMIKVTSGGISNWRTFDTNRLWYNGESGNAALNANTNDIEQTSEYLDILSNGFKLRTSDNAINGSSYSHVYAAFAEQPFGGMGVAPATAR